MVNHDIISMPDKWEYPWYAAWDLAFHTIALMIVDPDFAKRQLNLMLSPSYLHPTGRIPAYEWNFGDVNPPVHAFATLLVYTLDVATNGHDDIDIVFLKESFNELCRRADASSRPMARREWPCPSEHLETRADPR